MRMKRPTRAGYRDPCNVCGPIRRYPGYPIFMPSIRLFWETRPTARAGWRKPSAAGQMRLTGLMRFAHFYPRLNCETPLADAIFSLTAD